ncbi:hypothetical protein CAG54_12910 [Vibrio sp. V27_P1S3P104]|nr:MULTISPECIES: hypothetical protein [unclassified Vibrio]NAW69820.1 hypothetical protein [Vibrio sp. V28_P6S34P95]NAX03909.1 hypothetical protein [Vibrio sp. V30_P3S12P165]NAX38401.1 hypothetical protein [Vibrio sp. V27_P1S3P104]NAX40007.1 hypothetical protein [Vibrio sp. V26_P1S5P106]
MMQGILTIQSHLSFGHAGNSSAEQCLAVQETVNKVKQANAEALYIC